MLEASNKELGQFTPPPRPKAPSSPLLRDASGLTRGDERSLREIFDRCDANGDGQVNKRELVKECRKSWEVADFFRLPQAIRQEDGSRDLMEQLFQKMDTDGDREIQWEEFKLFFANNCLPGANNVCAVESFDECDVPSRINEILRRLSMVLNNAGSPPWKWDILELLEESRQQLRDAREVNVNSNRGHWRELHEALRDEQTASSLPVGLRQQCEELLNRREMWLGDFEGELRAILARGRELRERLLFEDADRAGWFGASGVSPLEVQRLLERHLDMHQRAIRLARQLKLICRALQQQGAMSHRRAFQAKTLGEKLQSSLVCLAAVAVAPVPGSSEMWLATTMMMVLDSDMAWQHVVYEHPRDADTESVLRQFQCTSSRARESLASWLAMPPEARRGKVLVHNASVRRVIVKTHLVNCIDGYGDSSQDWTGALDAHPLGGVMKKALTFATTAFDEADDSKVTIGAQRLEVVKLPPKPDPNWGWRGMFSYGDTKVGECRFREGCIFSFICVDCGLRVGDREEDAGEDGRFRSSSAGTDMVGGHGSSEGSPSLAIGDRSPQQRSPLQSRSRTEDGNGEAIAKAEADDSKNNPFRDDVAALLVDNPALASKVDEDSLERHEEPMLGDNGLEAEETTISTAVEVANRTDEPVTVKVFKPSSHNVAARLFRTALAEGTLSPGSSRVFWLKVPPGETDFDVEIKIGTKKAKCEVSGGQIIYVDGVLTDGP